VFNILKPFKCKSIGLVPIGHPPGIDTVALLNLAIKGPSTKNDALIFGGTPAEKYRYVSGVVSLDAHYLIISAAVNTSGNKLFLKDLKNPKAPLVTITNDFNADTHFIDNDGSTLFFETNLNAPNGRLVKTEAAKPQPEYWQDVVPETKNVLSITATGHYFFAHYMVDALSQIKQYNYKYRNQHRS